MKVETLFKALLFLLVLALAVTITSWVTSQHQAARAQGGGGAAAGNWLMVASEFRSGEGLIYMFQVQKEVLLVYAYHRGRRSTSRRLFSGDLEFLAGRHCKWDALYSQQIPYPTERPKSDMPVPQQIQKRYEKLIK